MQLPLLETHWRRTLMVMWKKAANRARWKALAAHAHTQTFGDPQRRLSKAFYSVSLFSQTAIHCIFLDTPHPTPAPTKKNQKKLICDCSLKEPWITTGLSTLSKLMVYRKSRRRRWGEKEAENEPKTQQDNQLGYLSSSLDSRFPTAPKLHFASLWSSSEACTLPGPTCTDRACAGAR